MKNLVFSIFFCIFAKTVKMAKESVLKEAIAKLKYNSCVLKEKRTKCSKREEVENIDKQLAQNESMILDYEYRIKNKLG